MNGLGDLAGGVLGRDGGNGSVAADREERIPRVGCEIPAGVGEDIVFAQRQGGDQTVKSIFNFNLADSPEAGGGGVFEFKNKVDWGERIQEGIR